MLKVLDTNRKHWLAWIVLSICLLLMVSCTASPTTSLPSNGEELPTYQIEINLLGAKHEALVDNQGRLKTKVELSSADGTISLSIDRDTMLLDKDGKPLEAIQVTIDANSPPPPEDAYIIGAVYDLGPRGTNFDPPIMLTLSYDLEEIPEGVKESNVYIASYDEHSGWGMWHYKRVDTKNHRVTTQIDYSTKFAILAPIEQPTSEKALAPVDRVEVIYFHRAQRCSGCVYAEAGTRYTLETYFADELASGKVTFEAVNVEAKENATIVNKYGAFTSSLFINTITDGTDHIEEVTDIWLVLGNDEEFVEVVKNKIEKSLGEIK